MRTGAVARAVSIAATRASSFAAPPALSFAALLAACSSPAPLTSDAPADVRWIAVAETDANGELAGASALTRWEDGPLPVFASDDRAALILGYSDPQIAAIAGGAAPSVLAEEPLRAAAACEPALPSPLWSARWSDEATLTAVAASESPLLTASWIDAGCTPVTDLWVDLSCQDVRCAVRATKNGCSIGLDLSECGFDRPRAVARRSGLCVDFSETSWTCTPAAAPTHAAWASSCRRDAAACTLTWYQDKVPLAATDRHLLLPVSTGSWRPDRGELPGPIQPHILARGYAWDLAPIGRRALVSVPAAPPREACDPAVDGSLVIVDGDRAAVVGTATAPPCLTRLSIDASGDAVLGLFAVGGQWHLGRFDADGHRVGPATRADPRVTGDAMSPLPTPSGWLAVELLRTSSGWLAVFHEATPEGGSVVAGYDEALAPRWRTWLDGVKVTSARLHTASTALLTTFDGGEILTADLGSGSVSSLLRLDARSGRAAVFVYTSVVRGGELLATTGVPPALFIVDQSNAIASESLIYDLDTNPLTPVLVPWAPEQVLVFGLTIDRNATVSTFLPEERRFLPGTRDLGPGPVSRVVTDRQQRIWGLKAWTGEIVILSQP